MRESHIEKTCKKNAEEKGYKVRKVKFIAQKGCPDRIFFKAGHFFWVEFKNEKGILSPMQIYQIETLKEAGQEVYVIDDIEQFKGVLK